MKIKILVLILVLPALLSVSILKKDKQLNKLPKVFRKQFEYVHFHSYTLQPEFPDAKLSCKRDSARTVIVKSFYCSNTEVTNAQYREFINDQDERSIKEKVQIDSLQWSTNAEYNEPYVEIYHSHPAYDIYPAVNVPYEGAKLYCVWLEEKMNLDSENDFVYSVNLPTREQFVAAASGVLSSRPFSWSSGRSPYPWGGRYLKNAKGCTLANFMYIGAESIHYNDSTQQHEILPVSGASFYNSIGCSSHADITAPVDSYSPNAYDLYNMSGNVAEMVLEEGIACGGGWRSTGYDIRCVSRMKYTSPQPDIGFRPVITLEKKTGNLDK